MNLAARLSQSTLSRLLTIVITVIILATLGVLGYVLVTPAKPESFTEFYILGPEGKAIGYPTELSLGDEGTVILGIVNQENRNLIYRVEIAVDGILNKEVGKIFLLNKEKWEGEVAFKPANAGDRQKVEFLLYEGDYSSPKEQLYLWVNVKSR